MSRIGISMQSGRPSRGPQGIRSSQTAFVQARCGEPSQKGLRSLVMAETVEQTSADTNSQISPSAGSVWRPRPKVTMPTEEKAVETSSPENPISLTPFRSRWCRDSAGRFQELYGREAGGRGDRSDVDEAIKRIADQNRPFAAKPRARRPKPAIASRSPSKAPSTAPRSMAAPAKISR